MTTVLSPSLRADDGTPMGEAKRLIEHFHMTQVMHEGPWFCVTYLSADHFDGASLPPRYGGRTHAATSAIYGVATRRDFSAMHRLKTDETWHFYGGDPIEMLLLYPDGHGETVLIGSDVFKGQQPQFTVPRGVWQGSAPTGTGPDTYSFLSNQLAPAFEYTDFEMGYRDELQKAYPKFAEQIAKLSRPEFATRPAGSPAAAAVTAPMDLIQTRAGALAMSNGWAKVAPVAAGPGLTLRELVGRTAAHQSQTYSIAHFTFEGGRTSGGSYNKKAEETFLVIRGHGWVSLDAHAEAVGPGSVVIVPPGVHHTVASDSAEDLEFYAVSSPAFQPDDFVPDSTH